MITIFENSSVEYNQKLLTLFSQGLLKHFQELCGEIYRIQDLYVLMDKFPNHQYYPVASEINISRETNRDMINIIIAGGFINFYISGECLFSIYYRQSQEMIYVLDAEDDDPDYDYVVRDLIYHCYHEAVCEILGFDPDFYKFYKIKNPAYAIGFVADEFLLFARNTTGFPLETEEFSLGYLACQRDAGADSLFTTVYVWMYVFVSTGIRCEIHCTDDPLVDIVFTESATNEFSILYSYKDTGRTEIKINARKVLQALAELVNMDDYYPLNRSFKISYQPPDFDADFANFLNNQQPEPMQFV